MTFRLYGFLLGLAVLAVYEHVTLRAKKFAPKLLEHIHIAVPWVLVGVVVGARAYHVMTDWDLYKGQPLWEMFAIWRGGLGIWGAIFGATIGLFFARITHAAFRDTTHIQWLDLLAGSLPLGQAIGRIGNAVNNELFGIPTSLPWGLNIPQDLRPAPYQNSTTFHPLFLYESIGMFLVWIFLRYGEQKKWWSIGQGTITALYLLSYGMLRFSLDFLRIEPAMLGFITIAQWWALFAVLVGASMVVRRYRYER